MMLNDSGCYIWDLLQTPITFKALITELSSEFGGEVEEIANDSKEFIEHMIQQGLVVKEIQNEEME